MAPETGSDQLRALVGKPLRNEAILRGIEQLGRAGVRRLRTYFIIGLPFEEEADVVAIGSLLQRISDSLGHACSLSATVNAFVPKPRTPFQWAPMAPLRTLRERARHVRQATPPGVRLRIKSFREARWQALISRGDAAWGERLIQMVRRGVRAEAILREEGATAEDLLGPIAPDCSLPWEDLMDQAERGNLLREWQAACAQAEQARGREES
jgi:radical SAM superfamily enzyme YgiQ (UPF0313 family)